MDKISSALDAAESLPVPARPESQQLVERVESDTKRFAQRVKDNREIDYDEARSNFKEMITQSMELIPSLVSLVREAESPRMYESASAFIKMVSELNKELLDLSATLEEKDGGKGKPSQGALPPPEQGNEAGPQVIFIGTSEELVEEMARRRLAKQAGAVIEGEVVG